MANLWIGIIGFLVLIQGGFFHRTSLLVCIILTIGLVNQCVNQKKTWKWKKTDIIAAISFAGVILCYLISGALHGFSEDIWQRCFLFLGLLLARLYAKYLEQEDYIKIVKGLVWVGMIEWLLLIFAMYVGQSPLRHILLNRRFMGTFQYANALGIWLVILLLALHTLPGDEKKSNWFPITRMYLTITLALTLSVGSILCYLLCLSGMVVCEKEFKGQVLHTKKNRRFRLVETYIDAFLGLGLGLLIYVFHYPLDNPAVSALIMFLAGVVAIFLSDKSGWCQHTWQVVAAMFGIAVIGGFGSFLVKDRAAGTFRERLFMMQDAGILLQKHPFTGFGGGSFYRAINQWKDVDYHVSLVHNSFLQIGVETGIFGMIFLFLFLANETVSIIQSKSKEKWNALMILFAFVLHICFDFTFFFTAIPLFAVVFVSKAIDKY